MSDPVQSWWSSKPMTYGSVHGESSYDVGNADEANYRLGSEEFFHRVDETFYGWNRPLHDATGKFGRIFPYSQYADRAVLEVGCGMGTLAMNWAQHGARITAVDLTLTAVEQSRRRFSLFQLPGVFQQEDGRHLSFADGTFDYGYSWGVLHHSPDLGASLRELMRVIKPGGGFGVMLYYRRSLYQWYRIQYIEGFLHGEREFLNPLALDSRYTDGWEEEGNPHTWPVTKPEIQAILGPWSERLSMKVLGTELDNLLPRAIPLPGVLQWLRPPAIKAWARRWGWSLWIEGVRNGVTPGA